MVETEERELLLQALKDYLVDLKDSGLDELAFAQPSVAAPGVAAPTVAAPGEECRGVGNPQARLLFVMAGAGFAGAAGELLVNIIKAMGFAASEVYLLSFPARPAGAGAGGVSRDLLTARIAEVAPEVVVTLGEEATRLLLESCEPIAALRGKFHDLEGIPVMPTLHPEALDENPALKREVWGEMQQVMKRLADPAR